MKPTFSNLSHASSGLTQLRRVHTITDRFSMANTYLIADERFVVVDPGSELNVRQLHSYLQRFLQRSMTDIDLIVLTHLNSSYTAGIEFLRHCCNAPVAASSAIQHLATMQHGSQTSHMLEKVLPAVSHHRDLPPPAYQRQAKLIDLWLDDGEDLPDHPDWRVITSPGHTPESLCVYNSFTRELLCGDMFTIQRGTPLVRRGTNRSQREETLRTLCNLQVHYLYPRHGRGVLGLHPLKHVHVE